MESPWSPLGTPFAEALGLMGFALYVTAYLMLSFGVIGGLRPAYYVLNLVAALLVLAGLTASFNLASALVQVFFIVCSAIALIAQARRRRQPGAAPEPGR